jgi:hypothetical protein
MYLYPAQAHRRFADSLDDNSVGFRELFTREPGSVVKPAVRTLPFRQERASCAMFSRHAEAQVLRLVIVVRWHGDIQTFAQAHRNLTFFLFLSLLLAIPARFIALVSAYLIELLLVGCIFAIPT